MNNPDAVVQHILAGVAVGALAVLGGTAARSRAPVGVRSAAALCLAGVGAYGVASLPDVGGALGEVPFLGTALVGLVCGTIGFYAVVARAGFDDKPARIVEFWPAGLLILIGLSALRAKARKSVA